MPTFRYEGYTSAGGKTRGSLEAPTEQDALRTLKEKGIYLSSLTRREERFRFRRRVTVGDLARFTRRLATLTAAAVPLLDALSLLTEQERNPQLKSVLGRVRDRVREGESLRQALSREPETFPESYAAMVGASETGGALDRVLERLASFLEDQERVHGTISAAMAYPLLMMVVGIGVMIFLLSFVIPKLVTVFAQNRGTLPLITRITVSCSRFLSSWWWLVIAAVTGGGVLFRRSTVTGRGREIRDRLMLRIPFVGNLLASLILSRVARIIAMLISGGVPLIRALEIAADVSANTVIRHDLERVRQEVVEGKGIAASLSGSPLFPPLLVQMIATGEKSGRLAELLETAAESLAREFDIGLRKGMALLEPALVLLMGIMVGFVVVSVLLPIFEMNQLIR